MKSAPTPEFEADRMYAPYRAGLAMAFLGDGTVTAWQAGDAPRVLAAHGMLNPADSRLTDKGRQAAAHVVAQMRDEAADLLAKGSDVKDVAAALLIDEAHVRALLANPTA